MRRSPSTLRSSARLPLLLLALAAAPLGAQTTPTGSELQVNVYATSAQKNAAVASAAGGGFVVVWDSFGSPGPDGAGTSVQGRRFAGDAAPLGVQFEVNGAFSAGYQAFPSVARAPGGAFVVVWSDAPSALQEGVEARRYAADGTPLGGAFAVSPVATGYAGSPDVGVDAGGNFVVVWSRQPGPNEPSSIHGRRYLADGTPAGGEFQVNTSTSGYPGDPRVATAADGRFVVVWHQQAVAGDDSGTGIQARRYSAGGVAQGDPFLVNDHTPDSQFFADVSAAADGRFVVAWQSESSPGTDGDASSVQARRFSAAGAPAGGQFQVNVLTTSNQLAPRLAVDGDGDFTIAWSSYVSGGTDTSSRSVQARHFTADGTPRGGDFQVNTYTLASQLSSDVATSPRGDFVIAWESLGSAGGDNDNYSVQAQRYSTLFGDGFETGDTSRWSLSLP